MSTLLHNILILGEAQVWFPSNSMLVTGLLFGTIIFVLGFAAGVIFFPAWQNHTRRAAERKLSQQFKRVIEQLNQTVAGVKILSDCHGKKLTASQCAKLEKHRNTISSALSDLLSVAVTARASDISEESTPPKTARSSRRLFGGATRIKWQHEPVDESTGLPNEAALLANFSLLLDAAKKSGRDSGLLFVKIDKLSHLKSRFGAFGVQHFVQRTIQLIQESVSKTDLLCHWQDDTFAILMPDTDQRSGTEIAKAIRNSIRNHHYRHDKSNVEVLVTASLGYTQCKPGDHTDVLISRGQSALERSENRGRNQLHLHEGETVGLLT